MQGSGLGALTWEPLGKRLIIEQIYDHQSNADKAPPLLVLDMWEHAYYLQYRNVKADWVDAFWKIALARRRAPLCSRVPRAAVEPSRGTREVVINRR